MIDPDVNAGIYDPRSPNPRHTETRRVELPNTRNVEMMICVDFGGFEQVTTLFLDGSLSATQAVRLQGELAEVFQRYAKEPSPCDTPSSSSP